MTNNHYQFKEAHRRALKNPDTRKLVRDLRKAWDELTPLARGQRLKQLRELGCTNRGLALDLGKGEATIRKYLQVLELSSAEHETIQQGSGVKRMLAQLRKNRKKTVEPSQAAEALTHPPAATENTPKPPNVPARPPLSNAESESALRCLVFGGELPPGETREGTAVIARPAAAEKIIRLVTREFGDLDPESIRDLFARAKKIDIRTMTDRSRQEAAGDFDELAKRCWPSDYANSPQAVVRSQWLGRYACALEKRPDFRLRFLHLAEEQLLLHAAAPTTAS